MMRSPTGLDKGQPDNKVQTPVPAEKQQRKPTRPVKPTLNWEKKLWADGHRFVAGVDEVGRGAWAGPLTVGVVVLAAAPCRTPSGLRDSKMLVEEVRERLFAPVSRWCTSWAVGHAGPEECDRLGMTAALGRMEEFELHFRGALNNGVSEEELSVILLQIAVYCGIPGGVACFRSAREVLADRANGNGKDTNLSAAEPTSADGAAEGG